MHLLKEKEFKCILHLSLLIFTFCCQYKVEGMKEILTRRVFAINGVKIL